MGIFYSREENGSVNEEAVILGKLRAKTSGLFIGQDYKKLRFRAVYAVMFLIMLIISLACILPPIWIFFNSLKDTAEFASVPPTIIPHSFHPEKIVEVWNTLNFWKFYLNSGILVLGEWIFAIVFNGLAGYVLACIKPKGSAVLNTLVFWTMMLPTSLNIVPLFISFVDVPIFHVNITNTYLPMWLMAGANAFYIMLFRNFFLGIPRSYIEAANLDGCSALSTFVKIILPMSKPILMVVSIFSITASWGSFLWPYIVMKDPNLFPITVKIFALKGKALTMDKYMLVVLLAIIPPTIIYTFCSKHIMGGLSMSGIKG